MNQSSTTFAPFATDDSSGRSDASATVDAARGFKAYRPDIDGLRALAVLAVILYHLGNQYLSGGYIGVDVFFVISGFLITRNICDEYRRGVFTFPNFYLRRARRLLPALFFTLAVSLLAGMLLLSPTHMEELGKSTVLATLSASNILFWTQHGYFDITSDSKPLLHTWSLGVEEQFYLVWPMTLVGLLWLGRRSVTLLIALALFIASTWYSEAWLKSDPQGSFFLTPFRLGEFLVGGFFYWASKYPLKHPLAREALYLAGIGMIVYAIAAFEEGSRFPGLIALIPCIGTGLAIYAGTAAWGPRVLSSPAAVYIGRISYSLYLIHWPLLVYYTYWKVTPIGTVERSSLFVLSLVSAALMYRYVETPYRRPPPERNPLSPSGFALACAAIAACICLISASAWGGGGWNWRLSDQANQFSKAGADFGRAPCRARDGYQCVFGERDKYTGTVFLVGDSHAAHYGAGLHELFSSNAIRGIGIYESACLFLADTRRHNGAGYANTACARWRNATLQQLAQTRDPVFIAARYHQYKHLLLDEHGDRLTFASNGAYARYLEEKLLRTLEKLHWRERKIVLFAPVPEPATDLSQCMGRPAYLDKRTPDERCGIRNGEDALDLRRELDAMLARVAAGHAGQVMIFDPKTYLCNGGNCRLRDGDQLLYKDRHHYTSYASRMIIAGGSGDILSHIGKPAARN